MEEKRLEIFEVEPVLRVDTEGRLLMSEAVQRAIDARIAKFAAAMEHSIRWSGGLLAESLKTELRKWAPCKVAETLCCGGGCPACNGDLSQCHTGQQESCYGPTVGQAQKQSSAQVAPPPLSPCCNAETFEADGRRVCERCRCTRPL